MMQTNKQGQSITLELGDKKELRFTVKPHHYISFVNLSTKHSFNAMKNFLLASVEPDDEEFLKEIVANPANVADLAGALLDEYSSDIDVTVKKRKALPQRSEETATEA